MNAMVKFTLPALVVGAMFAAAGFAGAQQPPGQGSRVETRPVGTAWKRAPEQVAGQVSPVDPDITPIPLVNSGLSVQFFTKGGVTPNMSCASA
jgi:hypothetical protein